MKSLNILNESEIETSTRTKKKGKKERCKNFLDWDRKNSWRENNRVSIPFKNWKLYSFAYIKYRIVVVMFCLFVWYKKNGILFIYYFSTQTQNSKLTENFFFHFSLQLQIFAICLNGVLFRFVWRIFFFCSFLQKFTENHE